MLGHKDEIMLQSMRTQLDTILLRDLLASGFSMNDERLFDTKYSISGLMSGSTHIQCPGCTRLEPDKGSKKRTYLTR